jgi:hypothetical protein
MKQFPGGMQLQKVSEFRWASYERRDEQSAALNSQPLPYEFGLAHFS